mgnify:FL=1
MTFTELLGLIVINGVAWLFFHISLSLLCFFMPLRFFTRDVLRIYKWEQHGELWQQLFHVKQWKKHLIDGSSIVKKSYNKRHLHGTTASDLVVFAAETKRAELTHWLLLLPTPLFFIWNPAWAAWVNVAYALLVNVPFIMTQRYNRGRLERIRRKKAPSH